MSKIEINIQPDYVFIYFCDSAVLNIEQLKKTIVTLPVDLCLILDEQQRKPVYQNVEMSATDELCHLRSFIIDNIGTFSGCVFRINGMNKADTAHHLIATIRYFRSVYWYSIEEMKYYQTKKFNCIYYNMNT